MNQPLPHLVGDLHYYRALPGSVFPYVPPGCKRGKIFRAALQAKGGFTEKFGRAVGATTAKRRPQKCYT